jgi:hypothetical protein
MYSRPTRNHDLSEYRTLPISGAENNCFFMAVFVSATIKQEPLGGDVSLATALVSGRLPENIEEEGLRVRKAVVGFLRANEKRPVPQPQQPSGATPLTWKQLYDEWYGKKSGRTYAQHVDDMSESGIWGTSFEQRVLWSLGHKLTVATGEQKQRLVLHQQTKEFVPLAPSDPVLWHRSKCHFDVLTAPREEKRRRVVTLSYQ